MRQIVILSILFSIMASLRFFRWGGESELNALSMASLGFILLVAYVAGNIFARVRSENLRVYRDGLALWSLRLQPALQDGCQ